MKTKLPTKPTDTALITEFHGRFLQMLAGRPDLIKVGRGEIGRFARLFHINYSTAQRIFSKEALPGAGLLKEMAEKFGVSMDWLMGDGEVDHNFRNHRVKALKFSPGEAGHLTEFLHLPTALWPAGPQPVGELVYASAHGRAHKAHLVVAELLEAVPENDVCLVQLPAGPVEPTEPAVPAVVLRRPQLAGQHVFLHPGDARGPEQIKLSQIGFGTADLAHAKCMIVGRVVAELSAAPIWG